jgi:thiol:disulfide interchange protein DsbD
MAYNRFIGVLAFLILCGSVLPYCAFTQGKPRLAEKLSNDSTVFTIVLDPAQKPEQGKTFEVKIKANPNSHWHLYSSTMSPDVGPTPLALSIAPELKNTYKLVSMRETGGRVVQKYDSSFEGVTKAIYGNFAMTATVKVLPGAPIGKAPLAFTIGYTTCSESICLPPRTFAIPMKFLGQKDVFIDIAKGTGDMTADTASTKDTSVAVAPQATIKDAPPPPSQNEAAATTDKDILKVANQSIWQFILLTVGFGLLALVTPCVFPMIPITVSFFTKRNQESRKEVILDATFYALGIIVTFVGLGFLLSLLFGSTGINRLASNPFANALIAIIFITFALNLFGLFEIGLPSSVLTKLNMKATSHTNKRVSVILMGFVFSLTSFTCTVPIVGTLMVAFQRGQWFVPLLGMTVFATIFALPFFLLALFPSTMKALPKSGGWLNSVKVVMGFLEIAAALKFISNIDLVLKWGVFSRDLVIAAWASVFIITTLYLLGRFNLPHDTPSPHIGPIRAVFAIVFGTFGIYMFTGFGGKPLGELDGLLPPPEAPGIVQSALSPQAKEASVAPSPGNTVNEGLVWHPRYAEALALAKQTGKNVFIDFTGYTCTNCRAMEFQVFSRKDVQDHFKDFVLARLYTDDGSPLNDSNQHIEESRFNTIALPFYAIVSPGDAPLGTFPGYTRDYTSFIDFLMKHKAGGNSVASK